jgi:hypothetical protein
MGTLLRNLGVAVGVFVLTWLLIQTALAVEMDPIEKAQSERSDTVIDELGASARRTTFVYLPLVALGAGLAVGFLGRNWRWAWLTALVAAGPVISSFVVSLVASPSYLTGTVAVLGIGSIVTIATVVMWWREGRTAHGA